MSEVAHYSEVIMATILNELSGKVVASVGKEWKRGPRGDSGTQTGDTVTISFTDGSRLEIQATSASGPRPHMFAFHYSANGTWVP